MKDLIKQYVDTGGQISEYQFNQLNDNLKKTYLRKRMLMIKDIRLTDYEFFALPNEIKIKYFNSLDGEDFWDFMGKAKNPDKIINTIISIKSVINKLESKGLNNLLHYSKDKDGTISRLLSLKSDIGKLNSDVIIRHLLHYSKDRDKTIDRLLSSKPFIHNLHLMGVDILLQYSKDRERIIDRLLSLELHKSKLDDSLISIFLIYSNKPKAIIKLLGDRGIDFIKNLLPNRFLSLISRSRNPDEIMDILLNGEIEYFDYFNSSDASILFKLTSSPERLRQLIQKHRPDVQLNETILK